MVSLARTSSPYRTLDESPIRATISRLRARIQERFLGSGLGNLADGLGAIARGLSNKIRQKITLLSRGNV